MKKILLSLLLVFQVNTVFANESHNHDEHNHQAIDEKKAKEHGEKHMKGVPTQVKNYFKKGTVDLVHRALSKEQIEDIKKETSLTPDEYFHTFIATGTKKGKKTQLGAATLVKVDDIEFSLVYDKNLAIEEVLLIKNTDKVKGFLDSFKGADHHKDISKFGKTDLEKKITKYIKMDIEIMQALWGKPHKH